MGVRQGDTLSPLLFALFINDFNQYISTTYRGLNIVQSCYPSLNDEDIVLLKLFVLLYADDTFILAENEKRITIGLHDKVHQYCTMYKLSVNIAKSKIIVFSRGKVRRFSSFKYGFDVIEVVSDYVYIGITMNYNNKFDKTMKKQLDQGRKAQFYLLVKGKMLFPIDIQCNLFEKLVFPIMLYGCEIWGTQPLNMMEISYRKLKKENSTPKAIDIKLHGIWRSGKITTSGHCRQTADLLLVASSKQRRIYVGTYFIYNCT